MAQGSRQIQSQAQQQVQTLSPQQILVVKLLELPAVELEDRIHAELLENPALEEGKEENTADEYADSDTTEDGMDSDANDYDSLSDYLTEDDIPDYKLQENNRSKDEQAEDIPFSDSTSFYEILKEQLRERNLTEHQRDLVEYLIGSLDDDGLLRKSLESICDELAIYAGIESTEEELEEALCILQDFDPAGIGARSLQECLLIQICRKKDEEKKPNPILELEERIIRECYEEFTRKHWEKIIKKLDIDEETFQESLNEITKLNPRPGASLGEAIGRNLQQIVPDFIVETYDDGTINISLNNRNVPELRMSRDFTEMVEEHTKNRANQSKESKEAMMFLGDHWIGTEPFMEEFKTLGIDAVVGSVGNGSTLRLISDIEGVKYTEGRLLPYFFPDVFNENGDPVKEAKYNWVTARRAILRKPIDRIGYGGYLKLALQFPEFLDYVEQVCNEFRTLYANVKGTTPYCVKKVAVLNCWGKMRAWGCHMVHHALYQKQNYSYAGIIESLSGAPFDVVFINFQDILDNPAILDDIDVIINVGDADTAHTGGEWWENPKIIEAIRGFVYNGGGIIGVGEPSGHQYQGHFFQLANVFGVEEETGFTLGYDKYNWDEHEHFILEDSEEVDFGEGKKNIYALPSATILVQKEKEVQMAVNEFGKGRAVYISGLPYSFENSRVLYRAVLWSTHSEDELNRWFSTNYNVDVHAYPKNNKYCVVNNTDEPQQTTIYRGDGSSFELALEPNQIIWYEIA